MGISSKGDESDDIEIISIGNLYTGPWDKKYWSSSRGKDRYPYPVGYRSLRTQNGITYRMEVLEGLKGPSFMISSADGKSCSGDTPDITWERFQKKGCSKLWLRKRFSSRIDGVEFFGFKNTFVQRLLRELVANVNGTAEQSSHPLNILTGALEPIDQLQPRAASPDSDLLKFLPTSSRVTGKRSRKDKHYNKKWLDCTHFKQREEKCAKSVGDSNLKQSDESISRNDDPSTLATTSEFHNIPAISGLDHSTAVIELGKHLSGAQRSMQEDSLGTSDHLNVKSALAKEDMELTGSLNHLRSKVDLLGKLESTDTSRDAQGYVHLTPHKIGGATNAEQNLPGVNDADLCAPDTLDPNGDSSPQIDMQVHLAEKDATATGIDVTKSEVLVTSSSPDDEAGKSASFSNVEKFDTDSDGQEVAHSTMADLLPRSLPLLKTFSRRKKKTAKPLKPLASGTQEENKIPGDTVTDTTIARELAEHSDSERNKENTVIASVKSAVSASWSINPVVPDSFDSDDPQDLFIHADASNADQDSCSLNHHAQLPTNAIAETNLLPCHASIRKQDPAISNIMIMDAPDNILAPDKGIVAATDNVSSINDVLMEEMSRSRCSPSRSSSDICIPQNCEADLPKMHEETEFADFDDSPSMIQIPRTSCSSSMIVNKMNNCSRSHDQLEGMSNSSLAHKFFACYVHPTPISMVQLIVKDNEIFICVKCGFSEYKDSTLFVYKADMYGDTMGCPSLICHMPISLQMSNSRGRENADERYLLQFTPDALSVVLLNSIKTPYCREGNIHCSCPACNSDCFRKNAVKIVKLNCGYASLVTRLETTQGVCCLLVCKPSFLLAADEGGKLRLWVMNSGWSGQVEDFYLPTFDCMYPSIVELKSIPKLSGLVVGHNGFGEFALWDIEKRELVSRFSFPGISVLECLPVSMFRWQRKSKCKREVLMDEIMNATKTWSSGGNQNHIFSSEDEDAAVWLLISTVPDPESQCEQEATSWRLALLINNRVIIGNTVDGSTASVTCEGHGIIGRCDGSVYTWELTTGRKLETLDSLKGSRISCIATDDSNSHTLAVAVATEGRLMVYLST